MIRKTRLIVNQFILMIQIKKNSQLNCRDIDVDHANLYNQKSSKKMKKMMRLIKIKSNLNMLFLKIYQIFV